MRGGEGSNTFDTDQSLFAPSVIERPSRVLIARAVSGAKSLLKKIWGEERDKYSFALFQTHLGPFSKLNCSLMSFRSYQRHWLLPNRYCCWFPWGVLSAK